MSKKKIKKNQINSKKLYKYNLKFLMVLKTIFSFSNYNSLITF